jgi:hypothetical protein
MKSPLRAFAVFMASMLCLCVCASAYSGGAAQAVSSSTRVDTQPGRDSKSAPSGADVVTIPGPLRSFLRMAGISQKISSDDVMPLLARNVYLEGYQGASRTEFLVLLNRYVYQARELQILAGASKTIRVTNCDDAGTLVQILGYRLREGCGQKSVALETANPERAFLTIDSGFPLTELEEALQTGTPFTYSYPTSQVRVLFKEGDWVALSVQDRKGYGNLVDVLLNEPTVAHLYWALSKNDSETRLALLRSPGLGKLLPFAGVLDFYGSQICIRSGRVIVPGGASTEQGWKDLVGASSNSPGEFVPLLLAKDKGWLAAYFDVLARVSLTQQEHLTRGPRLKRLYEAFRSGGDENGATRGVFRRAPELLVLYTRLEWEPTGELHVPGDLDVWKEVFHQKTDYKVVHDSGRRARSWNQSEQLLEAMTACSRLEIDSGPIQTYLMLNELDSRRSPENRLSAETARLLASRFSEYSDWYLIFSEFPDLSDASVTRFVTVADAISGVPNQILRTNALGAFQANVGLWQILARQGEIPNSELNTSWQKLIEPFAKISSSPQLFDAARTSLGAILLAANGNAGSSQDEIVDLLGGPHQESHDGQSVHLELTGRIRSVLDDQRLVSLDTLFALSDGLHEMEQGGGAAGERSRLLSLAGELREFEMPRPIFTNSEKISWAPGIYTTHHAELQVRTDLTKVIKTPGTRVQLEAARGQLAPFLRDTLVGLNYAYYEPPGAQVMHNNPLFVRAHDFSGITVTTMGPGRHWRAPMLLGAGSPAGGGAYLMGSLADLPYALATTEQDFIAPENVQALIWQELVPELLINATLPRWWNVSPNELHAVTLYQRFGEELLTASMANAELRDKLILILSDRISPQRLEQTHQDLLNAKSPASIFSQMMPADTFYLAAEFRRRFPEEVSSWGSAGQQLEDLSRKYPAEVNSKRLAKDFGVPHPTLAQTYASELLNVKPFPFFGGYSSRLFGESWESSNLYWARLADEMGYSPVMLNRLVPGLTVVMTAKIFATDLEDWPAMLRSMQETGEEFRQGKIVFPPTANTASSSPQQTVKNPTAQ